MQSHCRPVAQHSVDQIDQPARRTQRGLVAVSVRIGVRIQVAAATLCDQLEPLNVGRPVNREDGFYGRRRPGHLQESIEEAILGEHLHRGLKSAVVLRMSFHRVAQIVRIVDEGCPVHHGELFYQCEKRSLCSKNGAEPLFIGGSIRFSIRSQLKIGIKVKFTGAQYLNSLDNLHRKLTMYGFSSIQRAAIP